MTNASACPASELKTMSELSDQIKKLFSDIQHLQRRTHAEVGIVGAAIIEEKLVDALLAKMRPLNSEFKTRLFDGYGPLSSFSAKIDLSYAFQIIDKKTRDELTIIRKIRNKFAHSVALINFGSPEILAHLQALKMPVAKISDYPTCYLRKLKEIEDILRPSIAAADSTGSRRKGSN